MKTNNDVESRETLSRRRFLKAIAATGGAAAASSLLPGEWVKPVIEAGVLPAHAQVTQNVVTNLTAYAYITNEDSNTVSVIDTRTNTVVATIPIPLGQGPFGVAVSPDGLLVYVTNRMETGGNYYVSIIDAATNTVTGGVVVGNNPMGVAFNPAGTRAYAGIRQAWQLAVINTATSALIATPAVQGARGVDVTPDGSRICVTQYYHIGGGVFASRLAIVNATTYAVTQVNIEAAGADTPAGVIVTPDGSRAYVTNNGSDNVSVVNLTTLAVIATIPVGNNPAGIAVTPDGSRVYVANYGSDSVSVISTATNTVINTFPVGGGPQGVSVTRDGAYLYVANSNDNTVTVYDTATDTQVGTAIGVGGVPAAFGEFIGPRIWPV